MFVREIHRNPTDVPRTCARFLVKRHDAQIDGNMQLCQLLVAFSLFVAVTSELVCGIGNFEGSDFVNEHTLNTLLKGIDQGVCTSKLHANLT